MYNQQIAIIEQKIAELCEKAKLEKAPKLKVSKRERLASTSVFRNQITVGTYLLSRWREGAFSENDVYASLAHEIGHRMDFSRNIRSVNLRYMSMKLSYIALGLALIWLCSLLQLPNSWVLPLTVFAFWTAFLPWIVVRTGVPVELEADKNAVSCLIDADQLANSVVKKSRLAPVENLGPIETLEFLYNMLSHPSLNERLHNMLVSLPNEDLFICQNVPFVTRNIFVFYEKHFWSIRYCSNSLNNGILDVLSGGRMVLLV